MFIPMENNVGIASFVSVENCVYGGIVDHSFASI